MIQNQHATELCRNLEFEGLGKHLAVSISREAFQRQHYKPPFSLTLSH